MDNFTITTGMVRFSFTHLDKPYAPSADSKEKYSVTVLVPKSDTVTKAAIDNAIEAVKQNSVQKVWDGKMPAVVPTPIWNGDGVRQNGEFFGEECHGCWVFTANSNPDRKPRVVDANLQEIIDPAEIYSGMYGRVNVRFFAYNSHGRKGIGCGLNMVQKLRDGERLGGGGISVEEAFGAPVMDNAFTAAVNSDNSVNYSGAPAAYAAPAIDPLTGMPLQDDVPF